MRYVYWHRHKSLIRNFIFMVIGIYLGLFIYLYFHGNQLDQLIDRNEQLGIELKKCKEAKEIYEKENKERKKNQLIRTIQFHFAEELEPFVETELLKSLMEETHFLIGKNVNDIAKSPEFLYQLLNNRSFKVKEKDLKIKVKIIYIQSTTEIWLSIIEQKSS